MTRSHDDVEAWRGSEVLPAESIIGARMSEEDVEAQSRTGSRAIRITPARWQCMRITGCTMLCCYVLPMLGLAPQAMFGASAYNSQSADVASGPNTHHLPVTTSPRIATEALTSQTESPTNHADAIVVSPGVIRAEAAVERAAYWQGVGQAFAVVFFGVVLVCFASVVLKQWHSGVFRYRSRTATSDEYSYELEGRYLEL